MRYAARINGLTEIALTKLDVLDGLDTVLVCTAYEKAGKRVAEMPATLDGWTPVYIEMPGWDSSKVKSFKALPAQAKAYIKKLEELVGVPVKLVSVGPARDETFPA